MHWRSWGIFVKWPKSFILETSFLTKKGPLFPLGSKESCGENLDKMREKILGYNTVDLFVRAYYVSFPYIINKAHTPSPRNALTKSYQFQHYRSFSKVNKMAL